MINDVSYVPFQSIHILLLYHYGNIQLQLAFIHTSSINIVTWSSHTDFIALLYKTRCLGMRLHACNPKSEQLVHALDS